MSLGYRRWPTGCRPAAAAGAHGRARGPLRRPRQVARARRSRRADRLARPVGRSATNRIGHPPTADVPRGPGSTSSDANMRAIRWPLGARGRLAQEAVAPAAQAPVDAPGTFMMKHESPELATNATATWVADNSRAEPEGDRRLRRRQDGIARSSLRRGLACFRVDLAIAFATIAITTAAGWLTTPSATKGSWRPARGECVGSADQEGSAGTGAEPSRPSSGAWTTQELNSTLEPFEVLHPPYWA